MEKQPYQPSQEETKKAEELMTGHQKRMSESREIQIRKEAEIESITIKLSNIKEFTEEEKQTILYLLTLYENR